jgi:predicted O-methyltransferase YrrM
MRGPASCHGCRAGSPDAVHSGRVLSYGDEVSDHVTWRPPRSYAEVKGWFYAKDQAVLDWLLDRQERLEPPGDLLELGCYLGKSAILIGGHVRPGETFTVCDLFGAEPGDTANHSENNWSYATLTRQAFEGNYLTFHDELPTIIQATTDQITRHVPAGSCRFVHIDASHLWLHVRGDIQAARQLLRPDGLVVCDDYRSEHTPGVAAAVWTAVSEGGLRPICITGNKFYGTWGDPKPVQEELVEWLRSHHPDLPQYYDVLGHPLVRVCRWENPAVRQPVPRHPPEPEPEPEPPAPPAVPAAPVRRRWPRARKIIVDLLPPVVTRGLRRIRRRLR